MTAFCVYLVCKSRKWQVRLNKLILREYFDINYHDIFWRFLAYKLRFVSSTEGLFSDDPRSPCEVLWCNIRVVYLRSVWKSVPVQFWTAGFNLLRSKIGTVLSRKRFCRKEIVHVKVLCGVVSQTTSLKVYKRWQMKAQAQGWSTRKLKRNNVSVVRVSSVFWYCSSTIDISMISTMRMTQVLPKILLDLLIESCTFPRCRS